MTYRSWQVTAQIDRLGDDATLYKRQNAGRDAFNNTEWGFSEATDAEGNTVRVLCFRTYDNRNTEVQGNEGDRHRDAPLFLFPLDEWAEVEPDDRIGYPEPTGGETVYELQAPTRYDTHVEIFGEAVNHE
ncbi:SPP1 gp16-like head completion protein [Halorubrum virus HRTV-11]|nr:SPP1 gp16-like head completion protein [Halorubrum virus HRTV-11]